MGWLVILGSIPIVILGVLFQDAIGLALRNLWTTAAMLAGFGIVIGIVDHSPATADRWKPSPGSTASSSGWPSRSP